MKKALVILPLLALLACASDDNDNPPSTGDILLEESFAAAFDVLTVYTRRGDVGQQAITMVDALTAYSGGACTILLDPNLSAEDKTLRLQLELADERQAFDEAVARVADAGGMDIVTEIALTRARSIARRVAAENPDAAIWQRPCVVAQTFAADWALRRPV